MKDNSNKQIMSRRYELAGFAVLAVFGITILVVISVGHSSANPYLPKCLFHLLTGLHCPGCGATRAAYCLIHGQFATAFRYNPLFIAMLPFIGLFLGKRLCELVWNKTIVLPLEWQIYRLIAVTVCLYFVIRNVPLDWFNVLRPPE